MEKKIGAYEARRQFGRVLREVAGKDDMYIVEKNGEPVAAVVPTWMYEQWKKEREAFFDKMQEISERSDVTSEEEAMRIAVEAVRRVREQEAREAARRARKPRR